MRLTDGQQNNNIYYVLASGTFLYGLSNKLQSGKRGWVNKIKSNSYSILIFASLLLASCLADKHIVNKREATKLQLLSEPVFYLVYKLNQL